MTHTFQVPVGYNSFDFDIKGNKLGIAVNGKLYQYTLPKDCGPASMRMTAYCSADEPVYLLASDDLQIMATAVTQDFTPIQSRVLKTIADQTEQKSQCQWTCRSDMYQQHPVPHICDI